MHLENLKQLREQKGVSQIKCANETGIPLRTLQRYESGDNIGDPGYLLKLMNYFELDVTDFVQDSI